MITKKREHPKVIGERSEACLLAGLLKAGKVVLIPFGDNQRYDLVIDEQGEFHRIQVKTGRLKNGVVAFQPGSRAGGKGKRKGYHGQADLFGIYCPDNDRIYLVPVNDLAATNLVHLRIDMPKGNQRKNINWAKDYELDVGGR